MVNPFSKLGDLSNIMQQAKGMQQKMQQAQEELANTQVLGEAGGGLVQIVTNGNGEALGVMIQDVVLQEDKKILQGLIAAAINDANHKRESKKKEVMQGIMTGMGLPPDLDLFKG
jgi:DNA-binding YbaB/EbfC family protein